MTEQPGPEPPFGQQQPPYPPLYFPPTPGYPVPGYPGYYNAPYGRHPVTGEPLSEKSKVIAGLLQLLGLIGVLGIGRIYIGDMALGITQLVSGLLLGILTCGVGFILPVIWGIIDSALIFSDKARDAQGRPLRDGL